MEPGRKSVDDAQMAQLRKAAENDPGNFPLWQRYVTALRTAGLKGRARKAAKSSAFRGAERKALLAMAEGKGLEAPLEDVRALIRENRLTEARQMIGARLRQFQDDAGLLNLLGVIELMGGAAFAAEAALRKAMKTAPANDDVLSNLAHALNQQRRSFEAIDVLEPRLEAGDLPFAAKVNLASAYLRAELYKQSADLAEKLLVEVPDDDDLLGICANAYLKLGRSEDARSLLAPHHDRPVFPLADVWADMLDATEGRDGALAYAQSLRDLPFDTSLRLTSLLAEWGELEAARAEAARLIEAAPSRVEPYWLYGLVADWSKDREAFDRLEEQAARANHPPADRGRLLLTLGKARMDRGDHDGAFQALLDGNAALRSMVSYDVRADLEQMKMIKSVWSETLHATSGDGPAPVFIVGLPRSGSTLIETILSRHDAVQALGESPRAYAAATAVRTRNDPAGIETLRRDLTAMLTPTSPAAFVTDKLLANFLHIGPLAAAFPNARFIHVERDLRATCLSIFQAELSPATHPYAMSLDELADYAVGYADLMDHWQRVMGSRIIPVSYDRLVAEPEAEARDMFDALGIAFDPACLTPKAVERRVDTQSVAQARKPISQASRERWRAYEKGLRPLIARLEEKGLIPLT